MTILTWISIEKRWFGVGFESWDKSDGQDWEICGCVCEENEWGKMREEAEQLLRPARGEI